MTWPWVSRSLLEAIEAHHARAVTMLLSRITESDQRYKDLLSKYHQLTLQGYALPTAGPTPPARPLPDPVMQAVNAACGGKDVAVRQAALKQVAIDRVARLTDDQIIARIRRGNRPMDDMQDDDTPSLPLTPSETASVA